MVIRASLDGLRTTRRKRRCNGDGAMIPHGLGLRSLAALTAARESTWMVSRMIGLVHSLAVRPGLFRTFARGQLYLEPIDRCQRQEWAVRRATIFLKRTGFGARTLVDSGWFARKFSFSRFAGSVDIKWSRYRRAWVTPSITF